MEQRLRLWEEDGLENLKCRILWAQGEETNLGLRTLVEEEKLLRVEVEEAILEKTIKQEKMSKLGYEI